MHLPVGTLLQGGRYEIIRYISSGGFGCTYEARDTKFKSRVKSVAIKEFFVKDFCNRDADSNTVVVATNSKVELVNKLRVKFLEEADALFELEHPNIVRVTDTFEENGTAYYVMEYISGTTLAAIVDKEGSLCEEKALGYIRQVADALKYVHSHKRSHFDVKPQNIMVDSNDRAVLIDFGVSKQYDEVNGVNTSTLVGYTPGYAPMELTYNDIAEFSPTTDIYSLGATLFNLVTGTVPPSAGRVNEDGLPVPVDVSAQVFDAIKAAMQPRRKDRPQNIDEFLCLVESGNVKGENGKLKTASKREGENLFTHTASESSLDEVKDESDGETIIVSGNSSTPGSEKSHSANNEILDFSPSGRRPLVRSAQNDNSANGRQNDKDGNEEAERRNEKERSAGVVISNESEKSHSADAVISNGGEKSQKNKPGKSIWLILLLLLIAVVGAWFLFGGTGNGDAPKADTVKKDTPTPPVGEEQEKPVVKGDSILDANDHSDTSDGTKIEDDTSDGDRNISADQITDGNKVSESKTPTGSETDIKGSGSTVVPNNNEEVKNFEKNSIRYNVTDKAKKTVEVAEGKYTGSIVIPKTVVHNDVVYSVTSIGKYAFYDCAGLTNVTIPNSVKSIGERAFSYCFGLTSITIPNSVTSIGGRAFFYCFGLTSITIPNSVKSIGSHAFYECSGLTSITIPNSVTSIGNSAFDGCTGLTNVIKPDGISIGKDAFKGTPWLEKQK